MVDKMCHPPRAFIDLSLESDHMSKVDGFLVYHDQRFEINMLRVVGQSITVGLVHNGVHYTARAVLDKAARKLNVVLDGPVHHSTLDIQLHPAGALGLQVTGDVFGPVEVKLLMQEDLKSGEVVIKHNNKSYVVVKKMIDIEFDTTTPKKMLKIEFLPKYEDLIWKMDSSAEYDANSRVKVNVKVLHGDRPCHEDESILDIKVNDENRLEMELLETVVMTEECPLYELYKTFYGRYFKNGERKISVIVDKKNKSLKFIPKFMLKVETKLDSEKVTHIEIDITKPVRMIKLYYVSDAFTKDYNFIHTWEIEGDMKQRLIKQKMELQRGGVSTHMYQGDIKLINNARKIEVE